MNNIWEIFTHDFMIRALVVGVAVAISAALIGVPLVLRRNSMIGDGLSHMAFAAFAVATVLGWAPLWVALPVVMLASFAILQISRKQQGYGDAVVAVVSAVALAAGTLAISVSEGVNIDLNSYLFGSILAVGWNEVWLGIVLAILVTILYMVFYHRIFAISFDEKFARAVGVRTERFDAVFALACSAIIVLGMKLLGSLLISSLLIFPTLTAMQLAKTFRGVVLMAVGLSVLAFVLGLVLSFLCALPTGATVVVTNFGFLCLASLIKKIMI